MVRRQSNGRFSKGHMSWIKGKKGYVNKGSFKLGHTFNKDKGFGLSYFNRDKRWFIICRDKTKIPYARAIFEGYMNIKLSSNQVVHHINEIETDDRIENLMVLTRSEHLAIHRKKVLGARKWYVE